MEMGFWIWSYQVSSASPTRKAIKWSVGKLLSASTSIAANSDFGRFIPVLISTLRFVEIGLASPSNTRHEELDLGQNSMSPPVQRAARSRPEARITPDVAPLNAARTAQRAV